MNNAAGYGFLGIDEHGKASWDLICNLNIVGIEVRPVVRTVALQRFLDEGRLNW